MRAGIKGFVLLGALYLVAFQGVINAQDLRGSDYLEEETRKGKFYVVPEISLLFGTVTNVEAAPMLGFHLTERLSAGLGPHYLFYKYKDPYFSADPEVHHIYGMKSFSRLMLIKNAGDALPFYLFDEFFLHAEYEWLNLDKDYFSISGSSGEGRTWQPYVFAGAGITQRFSKFSSYYVMILWDVNRSFYSIYMNPVYRVGLNLYF